MLQSAEWHQAHPHTIVVASQFSSAATPKIATGLESVNMRSDASGLDRHASTMWHGKFSFLCGPQRRVIAASGNSDEGTQPRREGLALERDMAYSKRRFE